MGNVIQNEMDKAIHFEKMLLSQNPRDWKEPAGLQ